VNADLQETECFVPECSSVAHKIQHSTTKEESIVDLKEPPTCTPDDSMGGPKNSLNGPLKISRGALKKRPPCLPEYSRDTFRTGTFWVPSSIILDEKDTVSPLPAWNIVDEKDAAS
jgi:hypothetical protein